MSAPIIDEFDRLIDAQAVTLFTDTIQALSDHTRATTVVLVAVGGTVDDLIAEHESVERSLSQVPIRRMSPQEAGEIRSKSQEVTGMRMSDGAKDLIVKLAQGLPHYVHLLGLHSVRTAVDVRSWTVETAHVDQALATTIAASQQSLQRAYHSATTSPRKDSLFAQVLLACALAETDDLGYFAAADVRPAMSRIMGRPYERDCRIHPATQQLRRRRARRGPTARWRAAAVPVSVPELARPAVRGHSGAEPRTDYQSRFAQLGPKAAAALMGIVARLLPGAPAAINGVVLRAAGRTFSDPKVHPC